MGRRSKASETASRPFGAPAGGERLRAWLLALATALFVARPLYPSESAAAGDGLPIVMLWIALALFWLLGAIGQPAFTIRARWVDLAVAGLVVWHSLAGFWAARYGAPRPALNMIWEWFAYGLSYFMLRQLIHRGAETRAMVTAMVALAVSLSAIGLYQYFYDMPATRAEYHRNPEKALRDAGLALEAGSAERMQFEKRLESREPLATFALTNSLAGYLAPWLAVLAGIAVAALQTHRRTVAVALAAALPIGVCLLLTKSRSGYVAVALGVVLAVVVSRARVRRFSWKLPVFGAISAAGLVAVVLAFGGLDSRVVSETGKSLGYRLQYWRSTLAMIADHPWLGVGPGQFQNWYTAYKLPQASEEIADPHNFLLELWATAGTPGAVLLASVIGLFVLACWRGQRNPARQTPFAAENDGAARFVLGGAAGGFFLAGVVGSLSVAPPGLSAFVIGLPPALATLAAFRSWIASGPLPAWLPAVGVLTLLVNLLAAGGIGFPGVAGSLWLLLAVGLSISDDQCTYQAKPAVALVSLAATIVLFVACYYTGYRPVIESRRALLAAVRQPERAPEHLAAAAAADPWGAESWMQWAGYLHGEWLQERSAERFRSFSLAAAVAAARNPQSASLSFQLGEWHRQAYELSAMPEALAGAIAYYQRAVDFYPHSAVYHARLALALSSRGDRKAFGEHAAEALRLDRLTPHEDKKLPTELRQALREHGPGGR